LSLLIRITTSYLSVIASELHHIVQWRIQKFRKRDGRQCISPVVIYRKFT